MVNYSWGDKWDERQRREDERRYYGPNGGSYSSGSSGGFSGGRGYTSYPRRGSHKGRIVAIVFVVLIAVGGIVYVFNPLDVKGMIFKSSEATENRSTVITQVDESDVKEDGKTPTGAPLVIPMPEIPPILEITNKPLVNARSLELRVNELINEYRDENELHPLRFDLELSKVARDHSEDMAENNYFEHDNLQGLDPTGRAKTAGYSCFKDFGTYYIEGVGENIWQGWRYDSITYYNGIPSYDWLTEEEIAQQAVDGWIGSPGHRENILTDSYDRSGIGVALGSDDKVLITQDFC